MPKRTKLSTCRRKVRFTNDADATLFTEQQALRQSPYRCNQCNEWHLTSAPRFRGKSTPPRREFADRSAGERINL